MMILSGKPLGKLQATDASTKEVMNDINTHTYNRNPPVSRRAKYRSGCFPGKTTRRILAKCGSLDRERMREQLGIIYLYIFVPANRKT